jgi:SAM-dependent methyltransferase
VIVVDPSNSDQRESWDGPGGSFWAENADRMDAGLARYTEPFFAEAAIQPGERVLDIGCGNGFTSCEAARRGARVLGVDLSAEMLEVARERAARDGLEGVEFVQADAQVHPFPSGGFDLVISRHGTMFFGDPAAAFANIGAALRPGGRLALLVWRDLADNEWLREFLAALSAGGPLPLPPPGAPGPMSLAEPDRLRALLTGAGFDAARLLPVERPMWFGTDGDDAFRRLPDQFGWLLSSLPPWGRGRALNALREVVSAHQTPDGVLFGSAAWVVTASRPEGPGSCAT